MYEYTYLYFIIKHAKLQQLFIHFASVFYQNRLRDGENKIFLKILHFAIAFFKKVCYTIAYVTAVTPEIDNHFSISRFKKEVGKMELVLGIILLVLAFAIVALVLFQSGKDKKLSGTIAGGAETFFGKSKANDYNKALSVATTVVTVVFSVLVLVMYLMF